MPGIVGVPGGRNYSTVSFYFRLAARPTGWSSEVWRLSRTRGNTLLVVGLARFVTNGVWTERGALDTRAGARSWAASERTKEGTRACASGPTRRSATGRVEVAVPTGRRLPAVRVISLAPGSRDVHPDEFIRKLGSAALAGGSRLAVTRPTSAGRSRPLFWRIDSPAEWLDPIWRRVRVSTRHSHRVKY